jgi:hypothetical protein
MSHKMLPMILVAALVLPSVMTGCGASESSSGRGLSDGTLGSDFNVAASDSYDLRWNAGDDAEMVVGRWDSDGLVFDLEDTEGNRLSVADADGCSMESTSPAQLSSVSPDQRFSVIVDCAQRNWDAREGSDWDDFASAYAEGFSAGCEEVFDLSPDGSLYVDDWEYSWIDCGSADEYDAEDAEGVPAEVPDMPEVAGDELGRYDGCIGLFDEVGGVLFYGNQAFDTTLCTSGTADSFAADVASSAGFQSPTGNIRCLYDQDFDAVTCLVASLSRAVTLDAQGTATELGNVTIEQQGLVLQYGEVWTQSVFTCESSSSGILCAANVGDYGGYFAVNRDGILARSD